MNNYIQVSINTSTEEQKEAVMAMLTTIDYESFEEDMDGYSFNAFIDEQNFVADDIQKIANDFGISYSTQTIAPQNWNAVWEQNFEPIVVDEKISVRAHFHTKPNNVLYDIVITPKMSFGTGHHATTYMVLQLMQQLNFSNKTVYDFGTGTGILAIHAKQLGAAYTLAVDNDDWCIENSLENIAQNNCESIVIQKVETAHTSQRFEIVLANVNRHIILDNFEAIVKSVAANGKLIISGIMPQDEAEMLHLFTQQNFKHITTLNKDNGMWIAMLFETAN